MTRSLISNAAPLDALGLCRWIGQAAPGDSLEYHRGFLAIDVAAPGSDPARRKALLSLARRAAWASEQRFVHLVQRRIGPGVFAYLAVKRPRGFVAPPAIDLEGGSIAELRLPGLREAAA